MGFNSGFKGLSEEGLQAKSLKLNRLQ